MRSRGPVQGGRRVQNFMQVYTSPRLLCPVRTPYRTRLRAYQGPANPQRITDATANSRQRLRDAHRPAPEARGRGNTPLSANPAARMAPISAAYEDLD